MNLVMNPDYKKTEEFLKQISKHISSRPEYSESVCEVIIEDIDEGLKITIDPPISVFPDNYRRKSTDKQTLLEHLLLYHFPEILIDEYDSNESKLTIKKNSLLCGRYEFKYLFGHKRRQWSRC